jgi:homoserine kinase
MIAAFAPATVSNVAAGFDVLGFALDEPGDVVVARLSDTPGVVIGEVTGDGGRLARDPGRNTAGAAAQALLAALGTRQGIVLDVHKGLPLASGVGSSGASAVAAVVAVNELLGRPAPLELVCQAAMQGELAGCGAIHPDNVAPALYGGFVLARSVDPPDIVRLPVPRGLSCAVLHPHQEVQTGAARALLGDSVPLAAAVRQWANLGALVSALHTGDLALLSRSLVDHVAEPRRAALVPGFAEVKAAAIAAGALGCSLSGSGPSIFALASSLDAAHLVGQAMVAAHARASAIATDLWVSAVGTTGARIVDAGGRR